ncbi:MAG TPA: AI-2E family transporter [Acidimicrobiia bacterium]|nr:AI-2E family transporter [Acidimicrobiia bacterium]
MTAPYDSQVTEERVIVVVRPRAILLVVALALLALGFLVVADAASQVAERVVVAGVLASLVRPLTLRFARRMPLGIAAALTVTVVLAGFALLSAVEIRDLVTETHRLKVAVPARIEQLRTELEPEHPVRRFIEQAEVEPRIREWLGQLPARIVLGTDNPAKGAGRVTGALLVTVLTMFTITRGAQSVRGGIALFRHRRVRQALERIVEAAYRGGTGYTLRTLALAVASGVVAGFASQALGVPAPSVLGLWVGLWSLIPVLGLVIGYLPVIGLAAAENRGRGVVAVVVLIVWLVLAALARRRWIARHSVDVSRLLLTLSVMTGLHVGRISGAVVGLFLAAAFGGALAEARRLNVAGELSQTIDHLFALPPPAEQGGGPP